MKTVLTASFLILVVGLFVLVSGSIYGISKQGTVNPASITGSYDSLSNVAVFNNKPISIPGDLASLPLPPKRVLGDSSQPKRIEVDLTNQRLYAYEGSQQIYDFLVSSGKWGKTPTGVFHIWGKFRYVLMKGGSQALGTYYYLPNVPFTMFFGNDQYPNWMGFGIHGTYWHHNFGHPMSHGCINMKTEEAALIYQWASPDLGTRPSGLATSDNPGTEVVIYGTAPNS